ncbi:MAG: response regulator [Pseudobdellovibrionaceae bacterium]
MTLNVLIVDDEPLMGEVFVDSFTTKGIQIFAVTSPEAGLDLCQKKVFDIAFIDYRMPSMTGDLLAQKLPAQIYKVLVTGEMNLQSTTDFAEVIRKPFESDEVSALLKRLLQNKKVA